jgi:putative nucleotide binding protein|tara:strand:- start:606 stop:1142 length:537 start_codon:yes stop_codon:yes gene_type:complete
MAKEEDAIILDFLPFGYPLEGKMMPLAQAVGTSHLTILELVPRRGIKLEVGEKVYIGEGKRDKIQYILGRCPREKLTETSKTQLEEVILKTILADEERFVKFFNEAQAINTRLHQFELLPGFGKKHTGALLEIREERPFESFEDIRSRIPNIPDPLKTVEKRILEELTEIQRHNLFII